LSFEKLLYDARLLDSSRKENQFADNDLLETNWTKFIQTFSSRTVLLAGILNDVTVSHCRELRWLVG